MEEEKEEESDQTNLGMSEIRPFSYVYESRFFPYFFQLSFPEFIVLKL